LRIVFAPFGGRFWPRTTWNDNISNAKVEYLIDIIF